MTNPYHVQTAENGTIALTREILERLKICEGDTVDIRETANGIEVSVVDETTQRQVEIARRIMDENQDVLRRLAE